MIRPPAPTGGWRTARVGGIEHPSEHAVVIRLEVPDRIDHLPGQHYVVRLTAPDGYVAQRSYSVASPPSDPLIELYVERLPDGEVSGFLAEELRVGDELTVRGPIGGWFVWRGDEPALGIGGGSGVVPLVAMLRHARDLRADDLLRLAVSARTREWLPYAGELIAAGALVALTQDPVAPARLAPEGIDALLRPDGPCYACGSARFATFATEVLTGLGVGDDRIRREQFGPTS